MKFFRVRRSTRGARWGAIGLFTAGAACLGVVAQLTANDPGIDHRAGVSVISLPEATDRFSVAWVGDTLIGGDAQPYLDENGIDWPARNMPPIVADVTVANIEGPLTTLTDPFNPTALWTYQSPPEAAGVLAQLGIDVGLLGNNHAFDRGPEGLADTIRNLEGAGIRTIGAGTSSAESKLPVLVDTPAGTLAILSFIDMSGPTTSLSNRPGVRRLSTGNLQTGIRDARLMGARWVAAAVQWGENYDASVEDRQRIFASQFADAGYDLILGSGPHVVQPVEVIGHTLIVYSVGNFIFGTNGRYTDSRPPGYGYIATTEFSATSGLSLSLRCVVTNNAIVKFQPRPCSPEEAAEAFSTVGPAMTVTPDRAYLTAPVLPSPANQRQ